MKISDWLQESVKTLQSSNITTARLDALVLLEDITNEDRSWLLAHPEHELTDKQLRELEPKIERRAKHEPLAYIRGKSEFYGREFIVNNHTLEPRPETETIIDLLKDLPTNNSWTIIDIGTGSGCLAVSAKLELPKYRVVGTDIDNKCTRTAELNAKKYNASIEFRQGNLLEPFLEEINDKWIIIANLPYVPNGHTINKAAMFEPSHAIFGGEDGLDLYREMFRQINKLQNKPTYILTESLPFQHSELARIAEKSEYEQQAEEDFIQVFRYLKALA